MQESSENTIAISTRLNQIFIVGPTASGKSKLAIRVAKAFNGEVICADSQTLRKDLNVGTAKPSKKDQLNVRHHLLNCINPYESFSVNQFQSLARKAIADAQSRSKLPIIVGGTGLYIDSLFYSYDLDIPEEDDTKNKYKQELQGKSVAELQQIILSQGYRMPQNKNNPRHLIGVILRKGLVRQNRRPITGARIYGLSLGDVDLKKSISERVEKMFENGFVDEVENVISKYGSLPKKLDAIGYQIVTDYINGTKTLEEVKELLKSAHWQYARRQKSWFKRNQNIVWFGNVEEAFKRIEQDLLLSVNKSVTIAV